MSSDAQEETDPSVGTAPEVEEVAATDQESADQVLSADEAGSDEEASEQVTPEDELAQAKDEASANHERYLRAAAELENFRKRTVKMRADTRDETLRDVLAQVAPMLDNMRRALGQDVADGEAFKQGVELIFTQFQDILKGYGVEEIEAVGQPFDPNVHEAMLEVESKELPAGIVIEEMEKGYRLRERVMRPARVVVSKGAAEHDGAEGKAGGDGAGTANEHNDETEAE